MFAVRLCDIILGVATIYEDSRRLCRDFVVPDQPCVEYIATTEEEIDTEIARSQDTESGRGYFEFILLCRKVQQALLLHRCLLIHSVALEIAGDGYLLLGKSGVGKTTLARHCLQVLPNTRIINGDKPLVRFLQERILAYGTPWCGKENYCVNGCIPIHRLVFLHQAAQNNLRGLTREEAFFQLIHQVPFPDTAREVEAYSAMVEALLTNCRAFTYGCVNAQSAATDLVTLLAEVTLI
jgi:hypothetical protein